ncbi:MAG: metalloprotease PmbA [Hydrogenophilales bacterium CG_4_9_14_3_um_filter_59_35]|nr:MAG: metalloprotease PmbA [Zetaproteobacteria bacterium CG23_combo_of_CG06-09_8_20_14_all_54_7]PIQ13836.1 MAG: metalloprotease PmbA [Hydrogenophilales bacterium CG18_big_fil_WC_8_21_14_2_50_58_12]PIY00808.1 MAG: metalloprotease PmbA [Hydrogenophilales bacterium CG_4_10_14_3_um_filter_58_23]PJB05836.1 MAG: metalloprotease PmbA [Hydrogenophilales bacterium CG_4_9_14_3_um_filter_59_35]
MSNSRFSHSIETLSQITRDILSQSKLAGATACEAEVSQGFGQNVSVRRGEVETIEYNRDKGLGVTVYFGHKRGHASTSDLSPQAIKDTVAAAVSIARYTASDEFAGLADENLLAREIPDLSLYHPWNLSVEQAIELAKSCESAAFAVDKRIDNSEGASVSTQESLFMYGNSLGFLGGYPSSRHDISCAVIAEDQGMQRDYWYSSRRDAADLESAAAVGRKAGERTVRRLAARRLKTTECPVLFEAPIASGLIGHLVGAVSGGSLYRKSSFLLDSLGQQIFAPFVHIRELPHILKGLGSSPFDSEGVATRARDLIKDGVLQGYFLGSYSARKLGMASTGNAGGNHNLIIESSGQDFAGLLKMMGKGLVVTELLGHGINPVTGDYSRGAAGYWVENGEIQFPVEEITVAGNLKDMFRQIVAVGSDILVQGSRQCGSVLIERMKVAGA